MEQPQQCVVVTPKEHCTTVDRKLPNDIICLNTLESYPKKLKKTLLLSAFHSVISDTKRYQKTSVTSSLKVNKLFKVHFIILFVSSTNYIESLLISTTWLIDEECWYWKTLTSASEGETESKKKNETVEETAKNVSNLLTRCIAASLYVYGESILHGPTLTSSDSDAGGYVTLLRSNLNQSCVGWISITRGESLIRFWNNC